MGSTCTALPGAEKLANTILQRQAELGEPLQSGAYTRPLFSSTYAVLVTPPRVPLSNILGGSQAPNVSNEMYLYVEPKSGRV
jgi:hypothetical protein